MGNNFSIFPGCFFNKVMLVDTLMKYKTTNIHYHNKTMCTKLFREQKTALFRGRLYEAHGHSLNFDIHDRNDHSIRKRHLTFVQKFHSSRS